MSDIDRVQADGTAAARDGRRRSSNPHPAGSEEWMFWMEAFDEETVRLERHPRNRDRPADPARDPATTARTVHRSANGDDWLVEYDAQDRAVAVIHQANAASGGTRTRLAVEEFLERSGRSPEADAVRAALPAQTDRR